MCEAAPEMGLGIVVEADKRTVLISFPACQQTRRYRRQSAPLKRVLFGLDDEVIGNSGLKFKVIKITTNDLGLQVYHGSDNQQILVESDLLDSIQFNHPEERFFNCDYDSPALFNLRYQTQQLKSWLAALPYRGMLGGRISLINHQFYLAEKVTSRSSPRVLLADEVGLGKTIEAGLIMHQLIVSERVKRVLIILPNTLCHQWFVEMLRKYNLIFSVINEQTKLEEQSNPFAENDLVITSIELLRGHKVARELLIEDDWEVLVIDEAHKVCKGRDNEKIDKFIFDLSQKIRTLLLLTATPEMFGPQEHFERLRLLDPQRFDSYEKFKLEDTVFKKSATIAKKIANKKELTEEDNFFLEQHNIATDTTEKILNGLIDRHGTGRVYFRNSRKNLSQVYSFFPQRVLHLYPLEDLSSKKLSDPAYQLKIHWLINYLLEHNEQKVLLICRSKKEILKVEKNLLNLSIKNKIALFHSDLSLLARDRQAAYFADPQGANIMLCTEIGSEGRNFEFAHHLILFDLPKTPDLLEQRIGRLDRIGQRHDIHIHLPYHLNSWEDIFTSWYHEGLNAFTCTVQSANKTFHLFAAELEDAFNSVKDFLADDKKRLHQLIKRTKKCHARLENELEQGRDILIEMNSFNEKKAEQIVKQIRDIDTDPTLKDYLEKVFSHFGVDVEDLTEQSQFIKPSNNMFIPSFPSLSNTGMSITFNRKKALAEENLTFMSWDHPLVTGIMDLILAHEFGNLVIMTRKNSDKRQIFLECFYILEAIAPPHLGMGQFLPPTPIRILINIKGENFAHKWSKEILDSKLVAATKEMAQQTRKIARKEIKLLLTSAHELANLEAQTLITNGQNRINSQCNFEIERLMKLKKSNPTIRSEEIEQLVHKKHQLSEKIMTASLKLDSFRFIC